MDIFRSAPRSAANVSNLQLAVLPEQREVDEVDRSVRFLNIRNLLTSGPSKRLIMAAQNGNLDAMRNHIKNGASVTYKGEYNTTAAHAAAAAGRLEALQYLIRQKADLRQMDNNGDTPLHLACLAGWVGVAEEIVKQGPGQVRIDAQNKSGATPLLVSWNETTQMLLRYHANPNIADHSYTTPLRRAASLTNVDMVAKLLSANATVNAADEAGRTALWHACHQVKPDQRENAKRIVSMLADHRATCYPENAPTRLWPLHLAAKDGHAGLTSALINGCQGMTLDCRDDMGETPLMLAVKSGSPDTVSVLLEAHADPLAQDYKKRTAFHYAAAGKSLRVLQELVSRNINGISVADLLDEAGRTPLHMLNGLQNAVALFAKVSPGLVNHKDHSGNTPLQYHLQLSSISSQTIRELVNAGAPTSCTFSNTDPAAIICSHQMPWKKASEEGSVSVQERFKLLCFFVPAQIQASRAEWYMSMVLAWSTSWVGKEDVQGKIRGLLLDRIAGRLVERKVTTAIEVTAKGIYTLSFLTGVVGLFTPVGVPLLGLYSVATMAVGSGLLGVVVESGRKEIEKKENDLGKKTKSG